MEHKNIYWNMYADVWAYHQKYINSLKDDNRFWHGLIEDGRSISKKYNGNKFVANLIANEIAEFERVFDTQS